MKQNVKPIAKIIVVFLFSIAFFIGIYFLLKYTGIIGKFSNLEELKQIIISFGFWSYTVFAVLQFLQVTILPLPSSVTTLVGVILFGPLKTFILSSISILLGSLFAYFVGKLFGTKVLFWAIGKEKTIFYQNKLKKGNIIFFFMMLFPLFPDDILCMLAGLINMNFKFFIITNLITRPLGIFCLCFFGSGNIIPFHSWGLVVWIILLILLFISMFVIFKNKSKIEALFIQ